MNQPVIKGVIKGVRKTDSEKYRVTLFIDNKGINIGTFNNEYGATLAYDRAAIHYRGEFAVTNLDPTIDKSHIKIKGIDNDYIEYPTFYEPRTNNHKYKGYNWNNSKKKYETYCYRTYIGTYKHEKKAALVYDMCIYKLGWHKNDKRWLNFSNKEFKSLSKKIGSKTKNIINAKVKTIQGSL